MTKQEMRIEVAAGMAVLVRHKFASDWREKVIKTVANNMIKAEVSAFDFFTLVCEALMEFGANSYGYGYVEEIYDVINKKENDDFEKKFQENKAKFEEMERHFKNDPFFSNNNI